MLVVYFIGLLCLLVTGGKCELTWDNVYNRLSLRLDDIVFDMKSKENSMMKHVQDLMSTVTATNQKLASFEKRLSEVADCSAKSVAVDERLAYIDTHVKEVAAAEVGRRTHLLRRGLEQEKAATMTRFESLRKNQEKLLSRTEDIESFQGAIVTRADGMDTRLNETHVQILNLEHKVLVKVYNTSTFFTRVETLENTQIAMKGTEDKTRALIAVIKEEVKSTQRTFNTLQSQVQTLVGTQAELQSKTRTIEVKVNTTGADISRLTEDKTRELISVIEEEVKSTQRTFNTLQSQVQTLVGTQAELQSKTRTIEAQVDTTRADISWIQRVIGLVDGQWGQWAAWSLCTSDCNQTRTRSCDNPAPLKGGRDCPGLTTQTQECNTSSCRVKDCSELLSRGAAKLSGVYTITTPLTHTKIQVYCDMQTDGGGWTVFQKRFNGSEDFYRNFSDYETGFGSVNAEYWLGLKYIYEITTRGSYQLRVDIARSNGSKGYDEYGGFSLQPGTSYTLNVGSRVRSNGVFTEYSFIRGHNAPAGNAFSTYDHDVDRHSRYNCAARFNGGWWYNECLSNINLNGLYRPGQYDRMAMIYDSYYGLAASTMMFKKCVINTNYISTV